MKFEESFFDRSFVRVALWRGEGGGDRSFGDDLSALYGRGETEPEKDPGCDQSQSAAQHPQSHGAFQR